MASSKLQIYSLLKLVFPAKYRQVIFDEQVEAALKDVCLGVAERYQVKFLEIGTDKDQCSFLGTVSADI